MNESSTIKIRLHGTDKQTSDFAEDLKRHYKVLNVSDFYPDRKSNELGRRYLLLEKRENEALLLSKRLRQCRESLGLTQQQVADKLGFQRSTYSYYETGHTIPKLNTLVKLAGIFNVSCDFLLDGE